MMSDSRHRVLVAYASKYGTTGEVAEAIARTMCQQGAAADTMRIAEVRDLSVYDAVVIGGAIHYDKWMSEARHFVTANEDMLSTLPVAYFFTCGILAEGSEKVENKALRYAGKLEVLSDQVKPVSIGRFAGVLDYGRMNLFTRIVWKIVFTVVFRAREGDYRNWDAISAWAESVLNLDDW